MKDRFRKNPSFNGDAEMESGRGVGDKAMQNAPEEESEERKGPTAGDADGRAGGYPGRETVKDFGAGRKRENHGYTGSFGHANKE